LAITRAAFAANLVFRADALEYRGQQSVFAKLACNIVTPVF